MSTVPMEDTKQEEQHDDRFPEDMEPGRETPDPQEEEVDVTRFRPAMFQAYPLRTILYVLLGCAGAVGLGIGLYANLWFVWVPGVLLMGFGLYRLIHWYLRIRYTDIRVTNRRLVITQGIVGKSTVEVPHANISDVYVSQDSFNQLTDVGDILITLTGDDSRTVILMSVANAEDVAEKIRDQRRDRT